MMKKFLMLAACAAGLTLGVAVQSPASEDGLLFADDFSSGDLSKHNDYFRWGRSGAINLPGASAGMIEQVEGPGGQMVNAMRFRYLGTEDPNGPSHWQEVRFHLTHSVTEVRTESTLSSVAHPEVWVSYWMKAPDNYYHNYTNGTASGANQKGWLYLWKDRYEQRPGTPTSSSLHWWPVDDGGSRVTLVHSREENNWGHRGASYVAEERRIGTSTSRGHAFLEEEHGQWIHYMFGMRTASDPQTNDGFARIYINGELAFAWENLNGGADDPARNGYDRGYIMGYHNSAYTQTTTYYITDFMIGTTKRSVIPEPSSLGLLGAGGAMLLVQRRAACGMVR